MDNDMNFIVCPLCSPAGVVVAAKAVLDRVTEVDENGNEALVDLHVAIDQAYTPTHEPVGGSNAYVAG